MNKIFTKVATLSVGLMMAIGVGVALGVKNVSKASAEEVTITPSQFTAVENTEVDETVSDIRFQISNGTITADQVRVFKNATLTITAPEGNDLTSVELTCTASGTSKYGPGCFAELDGYSYEDKVGTWSGSAESITLTASSNQVRVTQFVISHTGGSVVTKYTVTYDANGGTVSPTSEQVSENGHPSLPTPTYVGYDFDGWQVNGEGDYITSAYQVTGDVTLVAHWTEKAASGSIVFSELGLTNGVEYIDPFNSSDGKFSVTFSKGSKYYNTGAAMRAYGGATVTIASKTGSAISSITLTFGSGDGSNEITANVGAYTSGSWTGEATSVVLTVGGTTGHRRIASVTAVVSGSVGTIYTVTYNANGGTVAPTSEQVIENNSPALPTPKYAGYHFDGWQVNGEGAYVTADYKVTADVTLVAHWTALSLSTIEDIYSLNNGDGVVFNGYYAGTFSDGIILMDGEYGVLVYKGEVGATWEVDETAVHVAGFISVYNSLYEIVDFVVSELEDAAAIAKLSKPTNYTLTGSESTSDLSIANRRTFVSGIVTSCEAVGTSGNYNVVVDGKALYLKKLDNVSITLKDESVVTISEYLTNNISKKVTIKGFTSFFLDFQVRVYGIVEQDDSYTAEQFAQQLLDATDTVCSVWDGKVSNKEALTSIWNTLGGETRWQALGEDQQLLFTNAKADYTNTSESVLARAAGRYNVLCKKYFQSNNFAGRDFSDAPVQPESIRVFDAGTTDANNSMIYIIVAISAVSVASLGVLIALKKKRAR